MKSGTQVSCEAKRTFCSTLQPLAFILQTSYFLKRFLSPKSLPALDNIHNGGRHGEAAWFRDNECTRRPVAASKNHALVFDFFVLWNVVVLDLAYLVNSRPQAADCDSLSCPCRRLTALSCFLDIVFRIQSPGQVFTQPPVYFFPRLKFFLNPFSHYFCSIFVIHNSIVPNFFFISFTFQRGKRGIQPPVQTFALLLISIDSTNRTEALAR